MGSASLVVIGESPLTALFVAFSNLMVKETVVPMPTLLSREILPLRISTSALQMERPSPLPPYERWVLPTRFQSQQGSFRMEGLSFKARLGGKMPIESVISGGEPRKATYCQLERTVRTV